MRYHFTHENGKVTKTTMAPNARKTVEYTNSPFFLVGIHNGAATLEDSLKISYKT